MIVKIIFDDKSIGLFRYTEDADGYIHLEKIINMNPNYVYGPSIKCFHKDDIDFYNNPYIIHNPKFHIVEYEFSYLPKNIVNKRILFIPLGSDSADLHQVYKQIEGELLFAYNIIRNLSMFDRRIDIDILDSSQFLMNFKDPISYGLINSISEYYSESTND